ncbi:hypothetical protein [Pedobacter westerhofensis]|nr:hypothetical protein [Pedobacter westerhofensis]
MSQLLEDSLLLIWNNRNSVERLELMEKIYSGDIVFFENDYSEPFKGFTAINDLIDKLQLSWPESFKFTTTDFEINHNIQYVSWVLGPDAQQPVAAGKDIAIIENGKIVSLYLFLDKD